MDILNVSAHPVDRNPNTRSWTFSRQKDLYSNTLKQSQNPSKTFITRPKTFESSPKTLLCCVLPWVEHNFTELFGVKQGGSSWNKIFPFANFNATEADRVVRDILYYRDDTVWYYRIFDNISTALGYLSIVYSNI